MSKLKLSFIGLCSGFINALFGGGGGIIAVTALNKLYKNQKKAQATTVAIILPMTIITALRYISLGYMTITDAIPYMIPGFFGSILGSLLLKRISNKKLKLLFSLIMLWAGMRLIIK